MLTSIGLQEQEYSSFSSGPPETTAETFWCLSASLKETVAKVIIYLLYQKVVIL